LFVKARDAYLARDWLVAETRLRELLDLSPTDGEAQLLLATLLRRVGRLGEAREALAKLSASDSGLRWRAAIAAERERVEAAGRGQAPADEPTTLPLPRREVPAADDERAAA
jgi:cytochrome c-type biogenesis protein CcmH/NrfG